MKKVWWVDLTDLDDQQKDVLKLPLEGRHLILGPPGSGKSNLLILRAKQLQLSNRENFRVLGYTQTLVRFLRAGKAVSPEKVTTSTQWLDDQLWQLEGVIIKESDLNERRRLVAAALLKHLAENNKSGLIHTLLIDEFQDYLQAEIDVFTTLAEHVFLVGDIRQQIHSSDLTNRRVEQMGATFKIVELELHYRIGRNICFFADRIAKPARGHKLITDGCQYDERKNPSSVERIKTPFPDQINAIVERIKVQLVTFPGEFIGVLCPTNAVLAEVANELASHFNAELCVQQAGSQQDFDIARPIVVSTIHSGKGLEYRCVHIPSAESLKGMPHPRELIYTAVTRARTTVTLYHDAALHDFLEDAIRAAEPPSQAPELDELF